ncbi:hypothetical protein D9X30_4852 [Cupriavidus sp. U2]|uniref:hypothetical protein n=1 Tax=Cupriavidus sp. U2 TaxID=2920269 RepID=UPI00129E3C68|nr:hypothetical protein [Cupriavidus sp. U2]KAI3590244.1 hypothetical protein D9X30_4852 [Cupriavidus sp. U2]
MAGVLGVFGFIAFLAFAVAQLAAGYQGIAAGLGTGWAVAAMFAAIAFRFTLPVTIGAFFGAMNVWGWHWAVAAVFAAPGLLAVIPGVLGSIFAVVKRR